MNTLGIFFKITQVANELFAKKTGDELQRIRDHFAVAYNEAQLCALVVVGMILRVFHIIPEPPKGSRSMWMVVGLLISFIQNLDYNTARSGPNPLDEMVDQGLAKIEA